MTLLSIGLVVFAGCTGDGSREGGDVEDLPGTEEHPPAWIIEADPAVSIGEADGDAAYLLSNVVAAVRLSTGVVAVANRGSQELRFYAADGTHLRTTGGAGDGPGEFRWLDWAGLLGDSVVAWDAFARSVSVYDSAGVLVRSVRLHDLDIPFPQVEGIMGREIVLRPRADPDAAPSKPGEYADSVTYLRFSLDSGSPTGRMGPYLDAERFVVRIDRLSMSAPVIFGREGKVAVHQEGILTAVSDGLEITVHDRAGSPVRTIRPPHQRSPARPADVAAARERVQRERADVVRAFPRMAPVLARLTERLPHRGTLPMISALEISRDGSVWVRGYTPLGGSTVRWSVFAVDGRRLAVAELPVGVQVFEIGSDWLLGRTVDETGVERVVLHRIAGPALED